VIDSRGPVLHKPLPDAMPRLDILLLTRFDWHGWNARAPPGFRQGQCIIRIMFLPVPTRDHLWWGE
jgi:hypothetical protein